MPPTNQPVSVRILQDLEAALALPDAGADYFVNVRQVKIADADEEELTMLPGVLLVPEGTTDGAVELLNSENTRWNFTAVIADESSDADANLRILRMVHDVHKALMQDRQRGTFGGRRNAIETQWFGWTPGIKTDDGQAKIYAECRFQVHFRTSDTDMTFAR